MTGRNGYKYTRIWFDFAGANPDKLTPTHTAMYLYLVELNNSLGWKLKFFAPAKQTMHFISLKSYNTYSKVFSDLVQFGFVKVLVKSKNQYQANLIALSNFNNAVDKTKDNYNIKQNASKAESNDSIDKLLNIQTNKQINIETLDARKLKFSLALESFKHKYGEELIKSFVMYWTEPNKQNTLFRMEQEKNWDTEVRLERWAQNDRNFKKNVPIENQKKSRTQIAFDVLADLTGEPRIEINNK